MRIDAHHHFWRFDPVEYDWIDSSMTVLQRDYLPADLRLELETAGVDGVISVQARQTLRETDWLLDLAARHGFIRGVVGWVPLCDPAVGETLDRLAERKKLRAVRHVLQGEDDDYPLDPAFARGIAELTARGIRYDLLIVERQLPQAIKLVGRHPSQRFILDHIAKPRIADRLLEPWATLIGKLAKHGNVACKLSGLVTEADHHGWTPDDLRPYFEVVLEAFGPRRLMFGSDWPVCLLASDYRRWAGTVHDWLDPLSADEQAWLLGGSATEAYGLGEVG